MTGYRILFDHLEADSIRRISDRLDNEDHHADDLRELKVPVNLPYHSNWAAPERINGEVVIDGIHYNYVSRRMVNDTLILLVTPNHEKTRIRHARETFFALVSDVQSSESDHQQRSAPVPAKKPFSFEAMDLSVHNLNPSWLLNSRLYPALLPAAPEDGHLSVSEQPPDQMI